MNDIFIIPYDKLPEGKRVILYGAGKLGTIFYNELKKRTDYQLIGWVDKYSKKKYDNEYETINDIQWILNQKYDYIMIAVIDRTLAYTIMTELVEIGIPFEKMFWDDYHSATFYHETLNKEMVILKKIETRIPRIKNIDTHITTNTSLPKVIWTCWLDGFENAPEIVKKCNKRLKNMAENHQIIEISLENVTSYIDIPLYVWEKYENRKICNAHFSDIIRVMLLAKYGGLWVDATCWFTDKVPEYYYEYDFFVFQTPMVFYSGPRLASNWLIASTPNNELILILEKYILEWWKHNDEAVDYFLMHYLMILAVYYNLSTYNMWKRLAYYDNVTPHIMQHDLESIYDEKRYKYICSLTPVHKLTYKYQRVVSGSLLEHILNQE